MGRNKKNAQGAEVFEMIDNIVALTTSEPLEVEGNAEGFILELATQLKIEPMQALLLAVFVNQSDDHHIRPRDIAEHFDCRTVTVLAQMDHIDALVKARAIRRCHNDDGSEFYRVPAVTLESLRKGHLPKPESLAGFTLNQWLNKASELLKRRTNRELTDEELATMVQEMVKKNQQIPVVQRLKQQELDASDLILYLVMSLRFINFQDDCIIRSDIDDYFNDYTLLDHLSELGNNEHVLQKKDLIECSNSNGQSDANSWQLTTHSKRDIYAELHLQWNDKAETRNTNLTRHEDIKSKKLYYNAAVTQQVKQLQALLEKDRMNRVLSRLADKGLRKGFTCLFYGGPGTGKTETVLQLARETGRDVMMVDVPSIRSKWVGETEKNVKELFKRYRDAVHSCEVTPILVFNEADALLNRRNEGSVNSVDKMENAMQNIILQEMEDLEGILIATTNQTGSLDPAFERRFLYKVEFEKPTPRERCHIWKSLLPDLDDEQSLMLAEKFDFSGGQIENIARKRIIADILDDNDTLDINGVIESCKHELLGKKQSPRIGFGLCG